jgi:1,4-dihydroxy-6-naphthoate synthase
MKKLKLAISTCPNDTFIFYALINKKLAEVPYEFEIYFSDIDELNNLAFKKEFDIIKISFNAFGFLLKDYNLLDSGSALGKSCGPILISKKHLTLNELENKQIGIPGKYTTANYLFDFASEIRTEKIFIRFDKIIPAILNEEIDAGVIIHESRFTFKNFGLNQIIDLGDFWEQTTGYHIPLGGIVIKKDIESSVQKKIDILIKSSINYAKENFNEAFPFIKNYAKELDDSVIQSHINLYVNNYTYSLGEHGVNALKYFYKSGFDKGIFKNFKFDIVGQDGNG